MKFGLEERDIDKIIEKISKFDAVDEAIIYGSRAKGNFKASSDIDLSLKGEKVDFSLLYALMTEIDDLLLPYTFDISIFNQIDNIDLTDHINRVGKVFFHKRKAIL